MKNTRKILLITLIIAMLSSLVYVPSTQGDHPLLSYELSLSDAEQQNQCDIDCIEWGFDFGIARWVWDPRLQQYVLIIERDGFDTSVLGDQSQADWTSVPDAAGVIAHEEDHTETLFHGGSAGTVTQTGETGIRAVVLCGYYNQIPEFSPIAALVAVAGSVLAFFIIRRK